MSAIEKKETLALVAESQLPCRSALAQLGLPKSTYYRWLRRQAEGKLEDRKGGSKSPWNKLRPEEESPFLGRVALARASPELSSRQLALRIVDSEGSYVSESTVFRILKREGLIKPVEIVGFKAGKEYHRKTKGQNELWATDCAHLKIVDWGWPFPSREGLVGIRHVIASPYRPQTNGKMERYHRTIKGEIYLLPHEMPGELKEAVKAFIEYYNYQRYHEGLGDVTPYDAYTGRHLEVIQRRKEAKNRTLSARKSYNRTIREQSFGS